MDLDKVAAAAYAVARGRDVSYLDEHDAEGIAAVRLALAPLVDAVETEKRITAEYRRLAGERAAQLAAR